MRCADGQPVAVVAVAFAVAVGEGLAGDQSEDVGADLPDQQGGRAANRGGDAVDSAYGVAAVADRAVAGHCACPSTKAVNISDMHN